MLDLVLEEVLDDFINGIPVGSFILTKVD